MSAYTVRYKLDKSKIQTIKVPTDSSIKDLLELVNKKHHLKLKTIYLKSYLAFLDLDDQLSDWPPDEDDAIFFFSENDDLNPEDFEDAPKEADEDAEDHSSSESESGDEIKPISSSKSSKSSSKSPEYPSVPKMSYPSIPTVGKEKPLDNLLETQLKGSFRAKFTAKRFEDDREPDEFYVYSTKDYNSMTNPTKINLPLNSTYEDTEKEIRKSLSIKKDLQLHIYLPSGIPFVKKYGKKNEKNKLGNFFNQFENAKHVLYAVITREINQKVLDDVVSEVCSAKDEKMRLLLCPISKCAGIGYSRIACLLGTFYYRGLRTYNFINSVARCTGFAPLISCLSSMLYHEEITGLMLATVTASLHTLFSTLLPKSTEPKDVFTRCLECACYIVHIEEAYMSEKKKEKKKAQPKQEIIKIIDIDKDEGSETISYLQNCHIEGVFYQYSPDIDDDDNFEIAILEKIPTFKIIEDIFNNYASFRPIPPLSARQVNITCIIQYVKGQTLLYVGSKNEDGPEEKINIIDPFIGEVRTTDVEKLASDVEKFSEEAAPLIEAEDVEELIVILFDVSGSMLSQYGVKKMAVKRKYDRTKEPPVPVVGDTDRFSIATQYLITFLNRSFGFKLPQLISLISFNDQPKEVCDFTPLGPKVETAAAKKIKISGTSHVWDALDYSITKLNEFNKDKKYPNAKPRILIFSDGIDLGSEKKQEKVCQRAIDSGIIVDSVIVSLVDSCESLCKFAHLTGGYSLRTEDFNDVNSLFEKESFLSLKLRPRPVIPTEKITKDVFNNADDNFDNEVDNYDFITKTHRVALSTPNFVMSEAKKSKKQPERQVLRLLREMKKFQLANDDTIKLYINSKDINNWKVYLLGPDDTFYSDRWWYLSITFSEGYPLQPPLFRFITVPYHINISEDGRVCASFLYKSYRSSYSVYELVTKVKELLKNPEEKSPISVYKRMLYFKDRDEYDNKVQDIADTTPDSVKTYLKGCSIDDDAKFKVSEKDFEDQDEEVIDDIDSLFDPDVPRPEFPGPTLIEDILPDDLF